MKRLLLRAFGRWPGERVLAVLVVFALVFGSFWFSLPRGEAHRSEPMQMVGQVPDEPPLQFEAPRPTAAADISTESLQVTADGDGSARAGQPAVPQFNLEPAEPEEPVLTPGGLFPNHRVLSFYGFPGNDQMGILGEYDLQRLLELLREQAKDYEEADPDRPVILAFEVIASVAQAEPQVDGSHLLDTPGEVLDQYSRFAQENGLLLILDVQVGYRTVENEITGLERWLAQEHVHLAIDPEFAMRDGQIPSVHIGQIDAADITLAQQYLVDLAAEHGLTPRMLIVHQFQEAMIENKDQVRPMQGVQLVIDADGWGAPDLKKNTYDFVNNLTGIEYAGIKLFYKQDEPLMSAEDIVNLEPSPLFVMYQ